MAKKTGVKAIRLELPEEMMRRFDSLNALDGITRTRRITYLIEKDLASRRGDFGISDATYARGCTERKA